MRLVFVVQCREKRLYFLFIQFDWLGPHMAPLS